MAYRGYEGKCIGRMLRFLYEYSYRADNWKFSYKDDKHLILDQSEQNVIGECVWCDYVNVLFEGNFVVVRDIPLFMFRGEWEYLNSVQVEKMNHLILNDLKLKQLTSGISTKT